MGQEIGNKLLEDDLKVVQIRDAGQFHVGPAAATFDNSSGTKRAGAILDSA